MMQLQCAFRVHDLFMEHNIHRHVVTYSFKIIMIKKKKNQNIKHIELLRAENQT